MTAIMVELECLTNLHVGDGDVNYNIVDREVERDPVTGNPTINASGVKGALREFLKKDNDFVNEAFGSDKAGDTTPGKLKILSANMLARPARASKGAKSHYLITTKEIIDDFLDFENRIIGIRGNAEECESKEEAAVEGIDIQKKVNLFGKDIYTISEKDWSDIALPVSARNHLDDGKSTNLWYEEVVPHESIFTFAVIADDSDKELMDIFKEKVNKKIVQFGANASIGYGLCNVTVKEAQK